MPPRLSAGEGRARFPDEAMIEMSLAGVRIELPTNQPIVLLREAEGERFLLFLALYDAVFAIISWASFEYVVTE